MRPSASTKVAGVVGWPIEHSLSPVLHNTAFRSVGLDWVYVAFGVVPDDAVATLQAAWRMGVAGLSVTMPHKAAAAEAAVGRSALVERAGVANTLVRTPDGWYADNTDVGGLTDFLTEDLGVGFAGRRVGVVGAGGVAVAAVVAAVAGGASEVRVWNRTGARAASLAATHGAVAVDSVAELGDTDIVLGCVPAGAEPEGVPFHAGQLVVDLAYSPPHTPLMRAAHAAGAETHNGLGMLVRQAARQFLAWTGRPAPVAEMSAAAVAALGHTEA